MSGRPLEVRIAVAEERIENLEEEQLRQRGRLHNLEADRALLKLAIERLDELARSLESASRKAAQEAIDLALDHRDEIGRRRWGLRLQWCMFGVAFGGLLVSLVVMFTGGGS